MTQQPQDGFDRSVEDAQEWMKAVQDQLQANDDTQGPRAALEARLLETEVCGRDSRWPWPGPSLLGPRFLGWASVPQTLMCLNLLRMLI